MKDGWREVTIGDECLVTDFVSSGSFASLRENVKYNYEKDYAVLVRTTDFAKNWEKDFVYVSKASFDFLRKSNLREGDVVISNVGAPGVTFKVPDLGQPMTLGPNAILVRTNDEAALKQDYIHRFFESPSGQELLQGITSGTTQLKFNKTNFRELRIPVPKPQEQQRIVGKLDAAFRALSEAEGHMERNRANARELFESYLNGVFEGKDGWEECKLGDICSAITKGTTPTTHGYSYQPEGINFIKVESVSEDHQLLPHMFSHVSEECHSFFKRSQLQPNDLLFSIAGALGRVAIVREKHLPANTNQALAIVRLNHDTPVLQEYLMWLLSSDLVVSQTAGMAGGAAQQNLSLTQMKDLDIAFPSKGEQKKIIASLAQMKVESTRLETTYAQKLTELDGLKKAVLGAAFRGEL
ncbi:MAG: restriction endonuclease subunit S [Flavobacteriales bacterium]|nr:restriction endonuclease subunit S [Flavobacteriales bacterium]